MGSLLHLIGVSRRQVRTIKRIEKGLGQAEFGKSHVIYLFEVLGIRRLRGASAPRKSRNHCPIHNGPPATENPHRRSRVGRIALARRENFRGGTV